MFKCTFYSYFKPILGIIAEKLKGAQLLNFECKLWLNHKYYLSQTFLGYRNKLQFLFAYLKK